jgi:hypothetical protein
MLPEGFTWIVTGGGVAAVKSSHPSTEPVAPQAGLID